MPFRDGQQGAVSRVDMSGVTFIDTAGEGVLAAMHKHGAKFFGEDCLTKAVIERVTAGAGPSSSAGEKKL